VKTIICSILLAAICQGFNDFQGKDFFGEHFAFQGAGGMMRGAVQVGGEGLCIWSFLCVTAPLRDTVFVLALYSSSPLTQRVMPFFIKASPKLSR
jgi:hypothetical protein